jgi:ABC-2 type transport system ATP-binding protein
VEEALDAGRARAEVIAVERLVKRFRGTTALRGISLALAGPQIIGVLGPNGAGKTTLLEILEGLSAPTEGDIRLFGAPLSRNGYPKRRVGVVMQREFVLDRITVGEYAELFAAIYEQPSGGAGILAAARLADRARAPVDRLSGGEAQRLFIAAAVVHRPELLFLDEPTAHLDPASKLEIGATMREMGKIRTVVLTTHDLREAEAVCDTVVFLVGGEVKAVGPLAELVAAVPPSARRSGGLEDAFFHFCSARIAAHGALE